MLQERMALPGQFLLERACAITLAASPRLRTVKIAAALAGMGILNAHQLEVFLPVGPLFLQWRRTETDLHPTDCPILAQPSVDHVP